MRPQPDEIKLDSESIDIVPALSALRAGACGISAPLVPWATAIDEPIHLPHWLGQDGEGTTVASLCVLPGGPHAAEDRES